MKGEFESLESHSWGCSFEVGRQETAVGMVDMAVAS